MKELTLQAARRINPRRLGFALAGIWATFAVAGLAVEQGYASWTLQAFSLEDSNLDLRLSMPASFTALVLLLTAGLAFALAGVDRTRRHQKWRLAGWFLLAFSLEELLGAHAWLQSRGIHWAVVYLPLLLLGSAALLSALRIYRRQPDAQAVFGAGIVLWLAGSALDNPDLALSGSGSEILEMAGAICLLLGLLGRHRYLARQYYPLEESETRLSLDQIAAEALDRIPIKPFLIGIPLVTAILAIQYVVLHSGNYHGAESVPILDLNNEQTIWATFQGSLILCVAGLSFLAAHIRATSAEMKRWWLVLGGVLIVLGLDEIVAVHDRFQDATGLPGQTILLPVAVLGVIAWLKVLAEISDNQRARDLFVAGAALWFVSQLIDVTIQGQMRWTITPEEVGETMGSTLWIFALLSWLRAVLPVGFFPPEPTAAQLNGHAIITPLHQPDERAQTPTG
jgi:hypothetical protein